MDVVSYRLYHTCFVAEWSVQNSKTVYRLIKSLSRRNAGYIQHLVLGPSVSLDDPNLENCVEIRFLTFYLVAQQPVIYNASLPADIYSQVPHDVLRIELAIRSCQMAEET